MAGVRGTFLRALGGAGCALAALLATSMPGPVPAGARGSEGPPAGLSKSERVAFVRAGAFAPRPVRLLVVGDSIALTLGMGLSVGARAHYGVVVSDVGVIGCDLDPQMSVFLAGAVTRAPQGCAQWRGQWPSLVAAERPQVVALGLGRWETPDHLLDGHWVHVGEPAFDRHLAADLQAAVSMLHSFGAKVVLFTMPYVDPTNRQPDGRPWPEDTAVRAQAYNAVVQRVAHAEPGVVSVIDLNHMLSPRGTYTDWVGGVEVRTPDGIHISVAGGELLRPRILPAVDRIGMEDEAGARSRA